MEQIEQTKMMCQMQPMLPMQPSHEEQMQPMDDLGLMETVVTPMSRDWLIFKMMRVLEKCLENMEDDKITITTQLLSHLHSTHPIYNVVTRDFIQKLS